jgi:hypothetical protein
MPYNRNMDDEIGMVISDDSISDIPLNNWEIPFTLTNEHVQRVARMWLDFAKQNMKLKEMVADIVAKKLKDKC